MSPSEATIRRPEAGPLDGTRPAWGSFSVEMPDELAARLEDEFKGTGMELGQVLSVALQLYLRARKTIHEGGTITFREPGDSGRSIVIDRVDDEGF